VRLLDHFLAAGSADRPRKNPSSRPIMFPLCSFFAREMPGNRGLRSRFPSALPFAIHEISAGSGKEFDFNFDAESPGQDFRSPRAQNKTPALPLAN